MLLNFLVCPLNTETEKVYPRVCVTFDFALKNNLRL